MNRSRLRWSSAPGAAGFAALWLALVVSCGPAATRSAKPPAAPQRAAFEFEFEDVNPASATHGQRLALSDVYAERGVVLNFLASWCMPCWDEMPDLEQLHRSGDAVIVAVAGDEYGNRSNLLLQVERAKSTIPVLFVPDDQVDTMDQQYDHELLPATYLIDRRGAIRSVIEGPVGGEELRGAIETNLSH